MGSGWDGAAVWKDREVVGKLGCIMKMGFEWSGSDEEVDSPAEFVQLY